MSSQGMFKVPQVPVAPQQLGPDAGVWETRPPGCRHGRRGGALACGELFGGQGPRPWPAQHEGAFFLTVCFYLKSFGGKNLKRVGIILQRGILILMLCCFPCWAIFINTERILLLLKQDPEVSRSAVSVMSEPQIHSKGPSGPPTFVRVDILGQLPGLEPRGKWELGLVDHRI